MSLSDWANNGWLRKHSTSKQEIKQLLEIVDRDLKDAQQRGVSADWRFGIAYNAALKLCTILMYTEGYRPEKTRPKTYRQPVFLCIFLNIREKR
jgi:hypothetical protein